MNTMAIVPGSISALCAQTGKSITESFMQADAIVIVDTSGSMSAKDAPGGISRYEMACQELRKLQLENPGKLAVIGFSDKAEFVPGGIPHYPAGMTDMVLALQFVKVADGTGIKLILLSDGMPNDPEQTISVARSFRTKIHTVFIGPESDEKGRAFMERLANQTGGEAMKTISPVMFADPVRLLLKEK